MILSQFHYPEHSANRKHLNYAPFRPLILNIGSAVTDCFATDYMSPYVRGSGSGLYIPVPDKLRTITIFADHHHFCGPSHLFADHHHICKPSPRYNPLLQLQPTVCTLELLGLIAHVHYLLWEAYLRKSWDHDSNYNKGR
jgi:hypothetical protein